MRTERERVGSDIGRWAILAFVVGIAVVAVLGVLSYRLSAAAVRAGIQEGEVTAAELAADFVEVDLAESRHLAEAFTRMPSLIESASERDKESLERKLRALVESYPRVVRAVVTDLDARIIADWPRAPESQGESFEDRDWFRRVTDAKAPIVSEVYRRQANPRVFVVTVAAPVVRQDGEIQALFLFQLTADSLSDRFRRIGVGRDAEIFLIDHTRSVVAHPRLAGGDSIDREIYSGEAPVQRALAGETALFERQKDPLSGRSMVGAAATVEVGGGRRWAVVAQQPVDALYAPVDALRARMTVAAAVLAAVGALVVGAILLGERRNRVLLGDLDRTTDAVRARDTALSVASHELRGPLGPLSMQLALLRKSVRADSAIDYERHRPRLDVIERQVQRLSRLVSQLLDAPRGRPETGPEAIDLAQLVRDVVLEASPGATRAGVTFELEVESGVTGRWDRTRLEQVVANLVSNAIKYAPGRPVRVSAGRDAHGHARIEVRDHGPGVPRADRERIFELFERASEDATVEGSGIGLWLVRETVRAHGGEITLEDAEGGGSLFRVELPMEPLVGTRPSAHEHH